MVGGCPATGRIGHVVATDPHPRFVIPRSCSGRRRRPIRPCEPAECLRVAAGPRSFGYTGEVVRRLFTLASAVSLVLCVGTAVLWIRSYWVADLLASKGSPHPPCMLLCSSRGIVHWRLLRQPDRRLKFRSWGVESIPEGGAAEDARDFFVAGLPTRGVSWNHREADAAVPHGGLFVLFAVLPACHVASRRLRRSRAFICSACGYDLRASPDRCPECGAAVVRSAPAIPPRA